MPKNGNNPRQKVKDKLEEKKESQKDCKRDGNTSDVSLNEDLDEVLDLATEVLDRSLDSKQEDLREKLNRMTQKVSENQYMKLRSQKELKETDSNNNASVESEKQQQESLVIETVTPVDPKLLAQVITEAKTSDKVNQELSLPEKIMNDKQTIQGREQNCPIKKQSREPKKQQTKLKPKNTKSKNSKFQGDGIRVEVEQSDEELDYDDYSSFSSPGETSSDSSSSSESSSSESESEDEIEEPTYRGSRKKVRSPSPSPKKRKRERLDRADMKKNKKLLKENPSLLALVEELTRKSKKQKKRKHSVSPRKKHKKTKVSKEGESNLPINPIKSPSTNTAYRPVLNMASTSRKKRSVVDNSEDVVAEYIKKIRLEGNKQRHKIVERPATSDADHKTPEQLAKEYVDNSIIQAEKFKATLAPPEGIPESIFAPRLSRNHDDDEDDFFHMTCHVELNIRTIIERGGFIELEKLLPKALKHLKPYNEQRLVNTIGNDGQSYFVPAIDKEYRITGVRKWDQAFRVYASIFAEANPSRAVEIMQYLHTINDAATKWQWDNVAQYDFIFRQKMAQKPYKSWAKIFTQLWTTTMVNPLQKGNPSSNSSASGFQNTSGKKNWREIACWRYNKRKCNKSAEQCKFEHRCSYCGGMNHIYPNCPKRKKSSAAESDGKDSRRVVSETN